MFSTIGPSGWILLGMIAAICAIAGTAIWKTRSHRPGPPAAITLRREVQPETQDDFTLSMRAWGHVQTRRNGDL